MPAAKRRAAVTPVPLAVWLSPPQRFALVVPRRSLPTRCRRDAPTRRHMHRANAWRRLVPGQPDCVGLPRCRASLDFFESLTGSPQALSAAITALLDAAKRREDGWAIRRHAVGVTRHNVAAGHFQRRRLAAIWNTRAREERRQAVSALSRGLLIHKGNPPATRWTPAESQVCRPRNSENTLRIPPPGKRPDAAPSARPPGSRCLRPCKPVVLSAVSACRRFQDQRAHPPPMTRPKSSPAATATDCWRNPEDGI